LVRAIAFYLPQFHPIAENDGWWGKGFTEWTNTAKAAPLFQGHYQPHTPADLGFYDLRMPEARAAQAELAQHYGIEAFCYYHYWFGGGRRILERPFDEVLASGEPDFPFCLCWANQSWTGHWHGAPNRMLAKQTYPGEADYRAHFDWLLKAFSDRRYLRVEGRPLLLIYDGFDMPDQAALVRYWRGLATQAGLPGLCLLAVRHGSADWNPHALGYDGAVDMRLPLIPLQRAAVLAETPVMVIDHRKLLGLEVAPAQPGVEAYPCIGPGWDNTPRLGGRGLVYVNSNPEQFQATVGQALERLADRPPERQLLFLKAWNEWAEGNHLEPDLRHGLAWLQAFQAAVGAADAANPSRGTVDGDAA
jgi:Glycosyltransferase WbsX